MGFLDDGTHDSHNQGGKDASGGHDRSPPCQLPWESDAAHNARVDAYDTGYFNTAGGIDGSNHSWLKSHPTSLSESRGDGLRSRVYDNAYRKSFANTSYGGSSSSPDDSDSGSDPNTDESTSSTGGVSSSGGSYSFEPSSGARNASASSGGSPLGLVLFLGFFIFSAFSGISNRARAIPLPQHPLPKDVLRETDEEKAARVRAQREAKRKEYREAVENRIRNARRGVYSSLAIALLFISVGAFFFHLSFDYSGWEQYLLIGMSVIPILLAAYSFWNGFSGIYDLSWQDSAPMKKNVRAQTFLLRTFLFLGIVLTVFGGIAVNALRDIHYHTEMLVSFVTFSATVLPGVVLIGIAFFEQMQKVKRKRAWAKELERRRESGG